MTTPKKLFVDTETCGLYSMPVLIQFALEDGPIHLYDIWSEPIWKTLDLIESWLKHCIVGFNLTFDGMQLAKLYTIWSLCPDFWTPKYHIEEIADREMEARDGPAIKFASALDLMLVSRKGEYQSLMARKNINIRKVPTALAYALSEELEGRVQLDGIYFAKKADPEAPKWSVVDREHEGVFDDEFKDVVLRFAPAGGLKYLAEHAMGFMPKFHYADVEPPREWYPKELGYAPFARALSTPEKNWEVWEWDPKKGENKMVGHAWPAKIRLFIDHWENNKDAREYAYDDIVYTRALDKHFKYPPIGDDDSILAMMVPVVRWHGFEIDKEGMKTLREAAQAKVDNSPINTNKPVSVRLYMEEVMDEIEIMSIEDTTGWSTKKANLISIREWHIEEDEDCEKCNGNGCPRCNGEGKMLAKWKRCEEEMGNHPAAYRAKQILDIKIAAKEVELYNKLLTAGRFHADFVVVGTKSSRMAGTSGLNAQGIKATKAVRRCFPLSWEGTILCGGDFDSFEVTLADAVYNDPALRRDLIKKIECPFCDATKVCPACQDGLVEGIVEGVCKQVECTDCQGYNKETPKAKGSGLCSSCDDQGMVRQKIHGLFGMAIFPGHTYAEILASSGSENDMYLKGKSGVFAMIYGGTWETLVRNLGVKEDNAKGAFEDFDKRYPGVAKAREKTFDDFCSMRQIDGVGSQVTWREPKDCVESFLGFKRFFTLENTICREMFKMANALPKGWKNHPVKVWRRDRVQSAGGAVSSALYGASFGLQQSNMRAAANHEIQSPGGQITKHAQRAIWDLQPVGVCELKVAPLNVHDEIMCVTNPEYVQAVTEKVREVVEHYRPQVPLIGMTWNESQANWAEKKGGSVTVNMCAPEME